MFRWFPLSALLPIGRLPAQVELDGTPVPTPAPALRVGSYNIPTTVIPGHIEAEEYDYGGAGVAYYDQDPGNNGGVNTHDAELHICWLLLLLLLGMDVQ